MKTMRVLSFITLLSAPLSLFAQGDMDVYLKAGADDASKMIESYISPLMKGFGYGINNGWYNTAKSHKTLGFDLTVTAHMVFAPKNSQYFTFNNAHYNNIRLAPGESDQLPTAFGPNEDGPELEILEEGDGPNRQVIGSFRSIPGAGLKEEIGMNAVPVPMAQLGIGIAKNTDLKLRYIPKLDFGDGGVSLWGIGMMHDVKQWIPGIKMLPFDLSALVGYTKLTVDYDMTGEVSGENQSAKMTAGGFTLQGIISKKISVLTLYGALGYNSVKSTIKVNGTYDIEDYGRLEDPVNFSFDEGSVRATAGFRLKLAILTLHADYTLNKYPILSAGVGFSVR